MLTSKYIVCVWIVLKSTIHASTFSLSIFYFLFFYFYLFEKHVNVGVTDLPVSLVHCVRDPLPLWKCKFCIEYVTPVGPVYYSQNPQIFFFNNFFIKNGFHSTIYTSKNYFTIVFSVFSKINDIQTDP